MDWKVWPLDSVGLDVEILIVVARSWGNGESLSRGFVDREHWMGLRSEKRDEPRGICVDYNNNRVTIHEDM